MNGQKLEDLEFDFFITSAGQKKSCSNSDVILGVNKMRLDEEKGRYHV